MSGSVALRDLGSSSVELMPHGSRDALREILAVVDRVKAEEGNGAEWFDVKLAVEEACTNIIEHGYGPTGGGPIELSLKADDERIVVAICDQARPFTPDEAPAPDLTSDWDVRSPGGLGWHLIKQLMDVLEYESSPQGGNRLTLIKRRSSTQEE
jgi:serine/threonine-protein kinase RsbW